MNSIMPSALFSDVHDAIEVIVADDKCSASVLFGSESAARNATIIS